MSIRRRRSEGFSVFRGHKNRGEALERTNGYFSREISTWMIPAPCDPENPEGLSQPRYWRRSCAPCNLLTNQIRLSETHLGNSGPRLGAETRSSESQINLGSCCKRLENLVLMLRDLRWRQMRFGMGSAGGAGAPSTRRLTRHFSPPRCLRPCEDGSTTHMAPFQNSCD